MGYTLDQYRTDVGAACFSDLTETVEWRGDGVGAPVEIQAHVDAIQTSNDDGILRHEQAITLLRADVANPIPGHELVVRGRLCRVLSRDPHADAAIHVLICVVGAEV